MYVTANLNESEVIECVRYYFENKGVDLTDLQLYEENGQTRADVRYHLLLDEVKRK